MVYNLATLSANRCRSDADFFENTIVNIRCPRSLKDPPTSDAPNVRVQPLGEQVFKIRLAQSDAARSAATMLVQKRYAWRGYRAGAIREEPNRITLLAYHETEIVGSLNIGYDSSEGLCADERYRKELDALRGRGCRLGELTKFACDERKGNKQVLAGMFNIAYLYGLIHRVTHALIEVTPRHSAFYKRLFDFRQIAGERYYEASKTNVVLMYIKLADITERVRAVGGKGDACKERSIYPYFMRPEDQSGIMRRLQGG